jgi:hypothetical protein
MKINVPQENLVNVRHVKYGDVFFNGTSYYIHTNPATHFKDMGACWGVRLEDGVLTKFGTESQVSVVGAVLTVDK